MATTELHTHSPRTRFYLFGQGVLLVAVLAAGPIVGFSVRYCLQAGREQGTAATTLEVGGAKEYDANLQLLKQRNDPHVDHNRLTDSESERLRGMTGLRTLHLHSPNVTDADLEYLKGLSNLHTLHICSTRVTDAGLEYLKGLSNLHTLHVCGTRATDAGLAHLGGLTNLHTLHLCGNGISDAGLVHLKSLTNLTELYLGGTRVTDEGVKKLQEALPNCFISHETLP